VGDDVWVTGTIGAAHLGMLLLQSDLPKSVLANFESEIMRYLQPLPRVELAKSLASSKSVNSMIDISDGFFQDLGHLSKRSNKQILLTISSIPAALCPECLVDKSTFNPLGGGDDYELIFTAGKDFCPDSLFLESGLSESLRASTRLSRVGSVIESESEKLSGVLVLEDSGKVLSLESFLKLQGDLSPGYGHFLSR
jgi:thiamine-monophosphate kinase